MTSDILCYEPCYLNFGIYPCLTICLAVVMSKLVFKTFFRVWKIDMNLAIYVYIEKTYLKFELSYNKIYKFSDDEDINFKRLFFKLDCQCQNLYLGRSVKFLSLMDIL